MTLKNTARIQKQSRDPDPNVLQRRASDPHSNVWVSASAGTGKTKVLTDRVLRLLMPRKNESDGTAPHKILCLTFTKAAASEMALRIANTLSKWVTLSETELSKSLKALLGHTPSSHEIQHARTLFAKVIDAPGGLKIMTIHAFCQSVLGRFPLEAGIHPNFKILEDAEAASLLQKARQNAFKNQNNKDALALIGPILNEEQFTNILQNIMSERKQFADIKFENLRNMLCTSLNLDPALTAENAAHNFCTALPHSALKNAAQTMIYAGTKTDQKNGQLIADMLALGQDKQIDNIQNYRGAFLTKDENIKAKLAGKKALEAQPDILEILQAEAHRVLEYLDTCKSIQIADLTKALLTLCKDVLHIYQSLKTQHNALDFDDLILKTHALLKSQTAWIHYKLDEGLDHIMVDEAQDTNPEQWKIIEALCGDFFTGEGARNTDRSIFVVGDEKQSIYSFQRASPEEFSIMQTGFEHTVTQAKAQWNTVNLNISFRSTQAVLDLVDAVFENPQNRAGVSDIPVQHISYRRGQAGHIELWPLIQIQEQEPQRLWDPPTTITEAENIHAKLAQKIATQIKSWLEHGETLPSRQRTVKPEDIMILVRTRNALVDHIIRALKNLNIPVNGADRLVLNTQIAIQDILAAAQFALLPEDDLNLACFLKSPFISIDEETLFNLSHNREGSLWAACKTNEHIAPYLKTLLHTAQTHSPYAFINWLLKSPCPADKISAQRALTKRLGKDTKTAIDELLNLALKFEHNHSPNWQHFVQAVKQGQSEVKREQDSQERAVRIMTVHGSKGLQAPIVILPDTTASPSSAPSKAENRLLWPHQTQLKCPLWSPGKHTDTQTYKALQTTIKTRNEQEYRRLLYVAMTRAEDRLYIAGTAGKRDIAQNCWYTLIKTAFENIPHIQKQNDGTWLLKTRQSKDPDRVTKTQDKASKHKPLPAWIHKNAAQETATQNMVRPSRLDERTISPLDGIDEKRFLRGNLTHKLLQILPDLPRETWAEKTHNYLKQYGRALPENIQKDIAKETLNVLNHPEFKDIFSPHALAETPVTGRTKDGKPVSGQIDRLLIKDNEILIIDFKTNRPPPVSTENIPQAYHIQMRLYRDILENLYPNHTIKTALLWTDGPRLMPLETETR